eukprot:865926-Alexandrium_andersonii.AAC.1
MDCPMCFVRMARCASAERPGLIRQFARRRALRAKGAHGVSLRSPTKKPSGNLGPLSGAWGYPGGR